MSENLCLKWTSFQENIKQAFGNIRNDKDFTDVALACEDGEQVEAHRVILAASSPFFKNILKNNKQSPHLLIYMRGLKSEDLKAILDFLYIGEATVRKENLDDFLEVASELKIAGLMRQEIEKGSSGNSEEAPKENAELPIGKDDSESKPAVKTEEKTPPMQSHFSGNFEELDATVKSMMVKSSNYVANRKVRTYADICKVCGKEGLGSAIKYHIEVNHLEGIALPCNHCANTFKTRMALRSHENKLHTQ